LDVSHTVIEILTHSHLTIVWRRLAEQGTPALSK